MFPTSPVRPAPRALALGVAAILFAVAFGGCRNQQEPSGAETTSPADHGDGIPWFGGTVEEAFALAKQERRPVFLYWGAVWCPPCHALRSKVFTRPEFRSRLAAAVPVYLDGDTERAQIWGEKLGAAGYPTVIVFDAEGREITRLNSMLPVEEYAEVLSRALDATRPISEVLAAAEADGPASLPPAELNLLAFYSWGQDRQVELEPEREREVFGRLWRETPAELATEKTRFLALYLEALVPGRDEEPPELAPAERAELEAGVRSLLADADARATNLDLLLFFAPETVNLLAPEPGARREELIALWDEAARAAEDDESLTTNDRLSALVPRLQLAGLQAPPAAEGEEPEIPEPLRERIRERIRWADERVRDENEMQAVMNTMAGLLEDAGLADEAKTLLSEKLASTTAPYYYIGWMASLEARAGREAEAIALYREAWTGARASNAGSSMTPFRWGSRYLGQALQRTPDDTERITADARTILDDLLASPDAFALGNWSRLRGLSDALEEWSRENEEVRRPILESLHEQIGSRCDGFPDEGEDSAAARCRSLVTPAADAAA